MEVQSYINWKKELYRNIINFIDCEEEASINILNIQNINSNKDDFTEFLRLISKLSDNHHRNQSFLGQVEKILLYFKHEIKQTFTNSQIFDIFSSNKRILLFLITNDIITMDKTITDLILKSNKGSKHQKYRYYFFNEIKPFLDSKTLLIIQRELNNLGSDIFIDFEKKCQNGQNE